ncbi:hypothetical protein GUJ93_ZPchr0001g32943 [Zizania palustris]|uniref:Late embryogenesis abundant protein LEA-2 subgroup domain-containing protein n=1 Tax=Zizania palustris TaxID=103762 RepID=A0A8J5RNY9_ZIZPA|nr:hypothetical protein GUJ93_ZPchr0001g32943 [Zizania palustris]
MMVDAMDKIRRHPRRSILGAFVGAFATIALVIAVSFFLRPPRLVFSVINASSSKTESKGLFMNLTLVANNTSKRAAVEYVTLDVMIWFGNTEYFQPNNSLDAGRNGSTATPLLVQQPHTEARVEVTAQILNVSWRHEFEGNKTITPFNLVVMATVWFKVGLLPTMTYKVRASCDDLYFNNHNKTYASCS